MFERGARWSLSLALTVGALLASARGQAAPSGELERLFGAAEREASALGPLIEVASERIAALEADAGHALAERLAPYCQRAFFGPERWDGMDRLGLVLHRVNSGEIPGRIAKRYHVSPGMLEWLNAGYDERKLQVDQVLKLFDATGLSLIADTRRCRLAAWTERASSAGPRWTLIGYWPVGIGAEATPTPLGKTRIVERARDPSWTDPVTRQVFAPGDPENILGGYWIRLDQAGLGKTGIGLHGYTKGEPAEWLGKRGSNGCLRLRQRDVAQVFHVAVEGTPVTIVE